MTQRFDELAAQRDPLYAATMPVTTAGIAFSTAFRMEKHALNGDFMSAYLFGMALFSLAIRALHNQGQPYYTEAKP